MSGVKDVIGQATHCGCEIWMEISEILLMLEESGRSGRVFNKRNQAFHSFPVLRSAAVLPGFLGTGSSGSDPRRDATGCSSKDQNVLHFPPACHIMLQRFDAICSERCVHCVHFS